MNEGLLPGVGSGVSGTRGRFAYTYVSASQTVNGPPWARYVSILAVAGGGGGGGGRFATTTAAGGGAGGGGGGSRYNYRLPMFFDAGLNFRHWVVTIGAGGAAGAGATVDGNNGTAGSSAGNTTVTFEGPSASGGRFQLSVNGSGGSGGGAGINNNSAGGSGGNPSGGVNGMTGGQGQIQNNYPSYPTYTVSSTNPSWFIQGGYGATGKNTQYQLPPAHFGFGYQSSQWTTSSNVGYSVNGFAAEDFKHWFFRGLSMLTRAPTRDELWFVSTPGGGGGTGSQDTTGNVSGTGGKGWNGTGGGGGAGAGGTTGSAGGTGGVGGAGFALLFWEEF